MLENFLLTRDMSKPTFIVDDLNMDLLKNDKNLFQTDKRSQLNKMCENNTFKNFLLTATRIAKYIHKKTGIIRTYVSLLDVVLQNSNLIKDLRVIDCPFSDHKFVIFAINVKSSKLDNFTMSCRNLSEKNLPKIVNAISEFDFNFIKRLSTVDYQQ